MIAFAGVLALTIGIAWRWRTTAGSSRGDSSRPLRTLAETPAPGQTAHPPPLEVSPRVRPPGTAPARPLSDAEKAELIEQIKRDYDAIRAKAAADYSAAGTTFPGGLNAFLRQLALLEREKRADFAAILTAAELEELEMRETTAGQLVQRLLGDTAATEAHRRAVFRLQREHEERFALTFDLSPPALLARETARQQVQEQIRGVLGDELFASWLRGEGAEFANFSRFVTQHGMPAEKAMELWRAKNDFILKRLELSTRNLPAEQVRFSQGALTQQMHARVVGILGPGLMPAANREVLGWLPPK